MLLVAGYLRVGLAVFPKHQRDMLEWGDDKCPTPTKFNYSTYKGSLLTATSTKTFEKGEFFKSLRCRYAISLSLGFA